MYKNIVCTNKLVLLFLQQNIMFRIDTRSLSSCYLLLPRNKGVPKLISPFRTNNDLRNFPLLVQCLRLHHPVFLSKREKHDIYPLVFKSFFFYYFILAVTDGIPVLHSGLGTPEWMGVNFSVAMFLYSRRPKHCAEYSVDL